MIGPIDVMSAYVGCRLTGPWTVYYVCAKCRDIFGSVAARLVSIFWSVIVGYIDGHVELFCNKYNIMQTPDLVDMKRWYISCWIHGVVDVVQLVKTRHWRHIT